MKKNLLLALTSIITLSGLSSCGSDKASTTPQPSTTAPDPTNSQPAPSSTPVLPDETTAGNGSVAVRMWGAADDFQYFTDAVTAYNATADTAKTIKLSIVGIGEGDAGGKLGEDPTTAPDIVHLPGNDIAGLAGKSMISVIKEQDIPAAVSISKDTLKTGMHNDAIYALPYTINTFFLYYNKAHIGQNDVNSIAAILAKEVAANPTKLGVKLDDGFYIQSVLRAYGLNLYGESGTSNTATDMTATNPQALKAAKTLHTMLKDTQNYTGVYNNFITEMAAGKLLTAVDGTWNYQNYVDKLGPDNFGMAVLPDIENDVKWGSPIDNKFIAMSSSVDNAKKEAVQDFLFYLASDDGQKLRYEKRNTIPTAVNLLNDTSFKDDFLGSDCLTDYYSRGDYNYSNPTASKFNSKFWDSATAFTAELDKMATFDEETAKAAITAFGQALIA